MAIIAKDNFKEGDFEKIPTGTQHAVCAFVEDIGTHEGSYNGKAISSHKIVICWELAELMTQGDYAGKPFMVSKFYTLSLNDKANLYKDLISWRGKAFTEEEKAGFDVEKLISVNCLLNIITTKKQNGKEYAEVASISPPLKSMAKLNPVCPEPPKWIQELREKSVEWREIQGGNTQNVSDHEDEGVPF